MSFPIPKLGSWATELRYPAGANLWNAQIAKIPPVGDLFTPGQRPLPENWNYLLNAVASDHKTFITLAAAGALDNWYSFVLPVANWNAAAADGGRWVALDGVNVYDSLDGGRSWSLVSTTGASAGLSVAANAGQVEVLILSGSSYTVLEYQGRTLVGAPVAGVAATAGILGVDLSSGKFLAATYNQSGGSITGEIDLVPYVTSGTTAPVAQSAPSSWTSAAGTYGNLFFASGPAFSLIARASVTAGASGCHVVIKAQYASGTTFTLTDVTYAPINGQLPVGLAYDAASALWMIATWDGTNSWIYTSTDGATWTNVLQFPGVRAAGLTAMGGVFACAVPDAFGVGRQIMISSDGGVTWHPTVLNTGSTSLVTLATSGAQVLALWGGHMAPSFRGGFV